MFDKFDVNKNGVLDRDEFITWYREHREHFGLDPEEDIDKMYSKCAPNNTQAALIQCLFVAYTVCVCVCVFVCFGCTMHRCPGSDVRIMHIWSAFPTWQACRSLVQGSWVFFYKSTAQ